MLVGFLNFKTHPSCGGDDIFVNRNNYNLNTSAMKLSIPSRRVKG